MSNILTFELKKSALKNDFVPTSNLGPAEIIIFPGVRYERCSDASAVNTKPENKQQKNASAGK